MKKLTPRQQELLDAINGGVTVYFMRAARSYYFRSDSFGRCTATAGALYERGLVARINDGVFGDHKLVRKEPTP